ncbi:MAG: cupin domain-containing protein [Candidatus Obscuribacterales bacterium]|nr:cupin domain-containing protein [Candidatus Obscuribacterales bacterium]
MIESKKLYSLTIALACLFNLSSVAVLAEDGYASNKSSAASESAETSDGMPEIKYELGKQPLKEHPGGASNEATARNFPISKGMAGVSMFLKPGALRELHWHANAAEWAYVIKGHCRITVIDPEGHSEIKDFGPGDVWYFPRGHGHSIQGIGDEECHFLLVFDSGYFSEFATFSASDWIAQTPPNVLGKNFGIPATMFSNFPKKEVYISQGPVPPPLPQDPEPESDNPPPLTHRFRLASKIPVVDAGGSFNMVDQRQFPISTTMSGALLKMKPYAMRQLHWHPNADEWQYYIKGRARMTVFGSQGRSITREYGPGDVGYVPMGCGHYLETVGDSECEILAVFNSGTYQEISLAEWLAKTPQRLLETNFSVAPKIIDALRKAPKLFSQPDSSNK